MKFNYVIVERWNGTEWVWNFQGIGDVLEEVVERKEKMEKDFPECMFEVCVERKED